MSGFIPVEQFGKDHWSLMGYLGWLVAEKKNHDVKGFSTVESDKMSRNPERYPIVGGVVSGRSVIGNSGGWRDEYSTRLKGFFKAEGEEKKKLQVKGHCDWACFEDLDAAGLIEFVTLTSGFFKLTNLGVEVVGQLVKHKARGNHYATFEMESVTI